MIRINLLSVREAEDQALRQRAKWHLALGAASVVVLLLTVEIGSRLRLGPLRAEQTRLQGQILQLASESKELSDLEKMQRELGDKLKAITLLENGKVGPVKALADLSDAIPDPVWLVEFTESGGAATLTGLALDNQTIAEFMRNLSDSNLFFDVDLVETTQSEQDGVPLKRFVINARLSYAGKPLPPAPADLKYPKPSQPGSGGGRKENRA